MWRRAFHGSERLLMSAQRGAILHRAIYKQRHTAAILYCKHSSGSDAIFLNIKQQHKQQRQLDVRIYKQQKAAAGFVLLSGCYVMRRS